MARALVGVSGWQYPDFSRRFYPENMKKSEQLAFYARQFPTVEINNTFYHLPKESTVRKWHDQVPDEFIFTVKASRYITHMKNLLEPEETLPKFFDRISLLKEKIGPVLFQLPPHWQVDVDRLRHFLKRLPENYRYAFELRNRTWLKESVYSLLREYDAAFCIYDFNYRLSPLLTTTNFIYIRMHGPGRAYYDPYQLDAIGMWADRIRDWVDSGEDVYCYFDNTHRGYAWENAKTLLDLLKD